MKLIYKGVDITDRTDIFKCIHEMHAAGKSDTVSLMIGDESNKWDLWGAKEGDEIKVEDSGVSTGTMYVSEMYHSNGFFHITAASAPRTGFCVKSKAWQSISLLKLAKEIAANNNLNFKQHDVLDVKYKYLLQDNESDFSFLHKMCILEGCAFLVFDQTLILYNESKMENRQPVADLQIAEDSRFKLIDNSGKSHGSCLLNKGNYRGTYKSKNDNGLVYAPDMSFGVGSNAEANRFAKNLLRHANKNAFTGEVRGLEVEKAYAPASVYRLKTSKAKSFNTDIFLYMVRNDYIHKNSKIFFRRVLEEY